MSSSVFSRRIFPIFAWALAFHSLVIALLFGWFELPEPYVRMIAAWKEVALLLLLLTVREFVEYFEAAFGSWLLKGG